jgi:mycothiol synthase
VLIFRPPTLDDAPAVAELIKARDEADFEEKRPIGFSGAELRDWWAREPERLATDAWIAVVDGQTVGFARANREGDELANVEDESCVHPDFRGRGIGAGLVERAESWARERRFPRLHVHVVNDEGRRLIEPRGFEHVRYFWRMEIDVDAPPRVEAPAGFAIRSYRPGADDAALHAMHQSAFAEHWEFVPQSLEDWLKWRTTRSDFDPELWQVAVEGDEIAGTALCFGLNGLGWVLDLAVGPRWRKRGLGLALLQAGFQGLHARGYTQIGLEVDSENETGATRLYERAGMHVTRRYATYEKRLTG